MARSFRSAASRCASTDFTPFPLSAFGAMAEVAGEIGGVVVLVATGGGALLSFGFEKKGGAAEIFEVKATNGEEGVPVWSQLRGSGREYPRARVRPRLRRPEEVVVLPQLLGAELRGEDGPLLP